MPKRNKSKLCILLILTLCFSTLLSGCSVLSRKEAGPQIPTKVITVKSQKDLLDGNYYVEHKVENGEKTEYYQLYSYYSNFGNSNSSGGASDVLWYLKDYDAIPTMYEGDRLVLRQGNTLPDSFVISRFMDLGFTFGFATLTENKYGNYYIDTSSDEDVLLASNAGKLLRMNEPQTVLYSIGETEPTIIRAGNVASGGVIKNLEKGKKYLCTFYTGTYKQNVQLLADTAAFARYETYTTRDMSYIDDDLVEIRFPENFNSGYYRINNFGLVRYVKGTDYNDSTDFNIPNDVAENVEEYASEDDEDINVEDESEYLNEEEEEEKEVYLLTVSEEKPVTITVTYDDLVVQDEEMEDPIVQVIGEDYASYIDKNDEENKFETVLELPIGRYRVEVTGLQGRKSYFSSK